MSEDQPSPKPRRHWLTWLVLFCVVWAGGWFAGKAVLARELASVRADLAKEGTTISCDKESWGGFPFRYTLNCSKPHLASNATRPAPAVSAENLDLVMWFPWPFRITAIATGPTRIDAETITHEPAKGSFAFSPFGHWSAKLNVAKLAWPGAGDAGQLAFTAAKGSKLISASVNASGLDLKGLEHPLLLDSFSAAAETDARLADAEQPFDMIVADHIPLTVTGLHLASGTTEINSAGELTLDANHKLDGKLASEINDIDALMALLAPALKLTEGEIAAAKTVISLLGGDPNSKTRKLDLIAKDGELYFGPFKFADVPPIE